MADATKREFMKMLQSVKCPSLSYVTSVKGWFSNTSYLYILLRFSNPRIDGLLSLDSVLTSRPLSYNLNPHVRIATVRFNRNEHNWRDRMNAKVEKYGRWLSEYQDRNGAEYKRNEREAK